MYNICGDGYRRRVSTIHLSFLSQLNTGIAKRRSPACRQGCEPGCVQAHCLHEQILSLYPPPQPLAQLSPKKGAIRQTTRSVYTYTHYMIPAED